MGLLIQVFSIAQGGIAAGTARASDVVTVAGQQVSRSGRLHIIWNGEPRFMLVADDGSAIRLLIDEALTRPFGGPRALNQKRVTITGKRVGEAPDTVRVLSIDLATEGG
jgi:hypothetical protein